MRNSTKNGRGTRPRGSSIEVWLTPEERAEITARAVESHHSQSSFLRAAVFGEPVQSKSDLDALKELAKVGGDVGRVAGVLKLWLAERRGQGARPIDVEIAMADCRELQATITATMSRTAFGKRRNKKARGTRPRSTRIDVWVTQEERETIGERAAQANLSASAYLRTVGLTYPVPKMINRDTLDEFVRLSRELNEVGGLLKAWLDEKPGQANVDVPSLMRSLNRIKSEMKNIAPQLLNERESV